MPTEFLHSGQVLCPMSLNFLYVYICGALRDLVPFVQLQIRERQP